MKKYFLGIAIFVLAACASTGVTTPSKFNLSPDQACIPTPANQCDPRFNSNYAKLKDLHDDLREDARALAKESNILNGLSATAATATLAFAGFKAHPDNTLVSTLIGGVSATTATQLKPRSRARLRIKGMAALTCIAGKADAFRDLTNRSNHKLNASIASAQTLNPSGPLNSGRMSSYVASNATNQSSYDVLDDLLYLFLAMAQAEPSPTDALKSAMASAQASRTKLALGIKAQNDAFLVMSDAIEAVRTAIEKEEVPSITALIAAISKIELPAASPPPATGSPALVAAFGAGGAFGQQELAVLLGFLSSKVDQLTPELDASTVKGMTACIAELSTN